MNLQRKLKSLHFNKNKIIHNILSFIMKGVQNGKQSQVDIL